MKTSSVGKEMTLEEYNQILPTFIEKLTKALLSAEEKVPGGLKAWFKALAGESK